MTSAIDTDTDADVASCSTDKRDVRYAKRRLAKSPELGKKDLKKRKETGLTSPIKSAIQSSAKKPKDWQEVKSRKKTKEEKRKEVEEQPRKQPANDPRQRKPRRPVTWSNVLIVRPTEKEKYADILRRLKQDVPEDQARTVDKVRKTATGGLLIVLSKEDTEKGQGLQKAIANILGDDAKVISKGPEKDLEIRDLYAHWMASDHCVRPMGVLKLPQ